MSVHLGRALIVLLGGWILGAAATELSAQSDPSATLEDFAWMAGHWQATTPLGANMEMEVLAPAAGVIAGFMRLTHGEDFWIQEYFVLAEVEGRLEMRVQAFDKLLSPSQLIVLRLREWDGTRAVFENPAGNYPKRSFLTRHADGSWTNRSESIRDDGSIHVIENTLRPGGASRDEVP